MPRPIRDGSKVNVGRVRLARLEPRLEATTVAEGNKVVERGKTFPRGEKERSRDDTRGVERARSLLRSERCEEMGIGRCYCGPPLPPLPPYGTPIARMRAKVKLRQVVTLLLPLSLPRHEPSSLSLHPCRVHRNALLFPHGPVLRFLEVTSFPRETICGYGGRGESWSPDWVRSTPFLRSWLRTSFGGGVDSYTIWRSRSRLCGWIAWRNGPDFLTFIPSSRILRGNLCIWNYSIWDYDRVTFDLINRRCFKRETFVMNL